MHFIRSLLNIYIILIIVDAVLSYFPHHKDKSWVKKIRMFADFSLAPIRKYIIAKLPLDDLPIDISPIILIFIVKVIEALW